jgi:hypothetical protein
LQFTKRASFLIPKYKGPNFLQKKQIASEGTSSIADSSIVVSEQPRCIQEISEPHFSYVSFPLVVQKGICKIQVTPVSKHKLSANGIGMALAFLGMAQAFQAIWFRSFLPVIVIIAVVGL